MPKLPCPHWLELPGAAEAFDCERHDGHSGKHWAEARAEAVGPRPRGGSARKRVTIRVEWSR